MNTLTREEIEDCRRRGVHPSDGEITLNALCDMALRSEPAPEAGALVKQLNEIAATIEHRPVLGHWPAMRADKDASAVRQAASALSARRVSGDEIAGGEHG